jgi:hypothetical protein
MASVGASAHGATGDRRREKATSSPPTRRRITPCSCSELGSPLGKATISPSRTAGAMSAPPGPRRPGQRCVRSLPRRLTRKARPRSRKHRAPRSRKHRAPRSRKHRAPNPSHFGSKDKASPRGSGPERSEHGLQGTRRRERRSRHGPKSRTPPTASASYLGSSHHPLTTTVATSQLCHGGRRLRCSGSL